MIFKNYSRALLLIITLSFVYFSNAQTLSEELAAVADIVVDINGTGDFTTIKEGLEAVPDSSDQWIVVFVKKGFYYEKVILRPWKTKVVLVGEDVDSTIISYDDHGDGSLPGHTFSSYSFRADAHDFQAYNITFENTNTISQAVAYHSNGDRQILYHCKIKSNQDTYFDNFRTRRYIKDCYIEGDVDYIFGFGVTLFDSCHIHSNDPGYITAASTPEHYEFGYVFKNCYITVRDGGTWSVSLGRPWFPYANTMFFECWLYRITPGGWSPWDGREETCIYGEYNNFGPGASPSTRVPWSYQLDPSLVPRYNVDTIFARSNFPYDLGPEVDSIEFWSVRNRFEDAGYAERADTILYAGRDYWPEYPEDDWSPEFYDPVFSIITEYTTPFVNDVDTTTVGINNLVIEDHGLTVLSPMKNNLIISNEKNINSDAVLSLFDLSGRKIFDYKLQSIPEGFSEIPIQSLGLGTGIYIYHIETKDFRVGGKVLKN